MKNLKHLGIIVLLAVIVSVSVSATPNGGTYVEQSTGYEMILSGGKGVRNGNTWGTVSITADGETTTGKWIDYDSSLVITFDDGFLSGKKASYQVSLDKLTGNGEIWIRKR